MLRTEGRTDTAYNELPDGGRLVKWLKFTLINFDTCLPEISKFAIVRLRANKINYFVEYVSWWPGGGALPYVGGYQVPVNRPPFFMPTLHPMTPFFHSVHTHWPPFFHFCIKFYIKIANFCALCAHFEKFNDFVAILTGNLQILPWNCTFAHWMTPISGSPHQKSPHFFGAHTEWPPFFDEILHRMPPIFVLR